MTIPSPENEDDVRCIGLTSFVSKQLERLMLNWSCPYLQPHMDPDQINMVQFILSSMDKSNNISVLGVPVDYSKAFNRILHSDIIVKQVTPS